MIKKTIVISVELNDKLGKIAHKEDRSQSAIIRLALRDYLN